MGRIGSLDEVSRVAARARSQGRRVVFTNGCFDLFHVGHLRSLEAARALGDLLVVGINEDASVRRLKGPLRPYLALPHRAELLASLTVVDWVVPFAEETPLHMIRTIRPQILAKGADYAGREVVGAEEVKRWGGSVHLLDLVPGVSTTELARRICDAGIPADSEGADSEKSPARGCSDEHDGDERS